MSKKRRSSVLELHMPANHSDDTPIDLDEDTKAAAMKKCQEAYSALSFVHDFIKNGSFTVSTRFNGLGLAQSHLDDMKKMLGADTDDEQRRDSDRKHMRATNEENQRLREEMAKGVTAESVGHKLYELKQTVTNWWEQLGFSYSKGEFDAHGHGGNYKVNFSANIDTHLDFRERETPVTSRKKKDEKLENLSEILDVYAADGHVRKSDLAVIDTPKNRLWLTDKLKTRFPSIRIFSIKSISIHNTDLFQIREIEAYINIEDIEEDESL